MINNLTEVLDEIEKIRKLIFSMDSQNLEIEDIAVIIIAYLSDISVEIIKRQKFSERLDSYVNACRIKCSGSWGELESNPENEKDCYLEICKKWSDIHRSPKALYRDLQANFDGGLEVIDSNIRECENFYPSRWPSPCEEMWMLIYPQEGWKHLKKEYIKRNTCLRKKFRRLKNSAKITKPCIERKSRLEASNPWSAILVQEVDCQNLALGRQFRISHFSPINYKFLRWKPDADSLHHYMSFISQLKKIFDADYREFQDPMGSYIEKFNVVEECLNDLSGFLMPMRESAIRACIKMYSGHSRDPYSFIVLSLVQIEGIFNDLCNLKSKSLVAKKKLRNMKDKTDFLYSKSGGS